MAWRHRISGLSPAIVAVILTLSSLATGAAEEPARTLAFDGESLTLEIAAKRPFRAFTLADPARIVLDISGVDLGGIGGAGPAPAGQVAAIRYGLFTPGWSRIVLDLAAPQRIVAVAYDPGPEARLRLRLGPTDADAFRATAGPPPAALWGAQPGAVRKVEPGMEPAGTALAPPLARRIRAAGEPMVVVIDPGHGGVDPGAVREGLSEKAIVLDVARAVAGVLAASGRYRVHLTRSDDTFVPLRARVGVAQATGAEAFLSLHVNTVTEGDATGVSIYSLSAAASDAAAARLADLENRADVFAGLDLEGEASEVTRVLVDIAQRETNARSRQLAGVLLARMGDRASLIRSNPHREAGFRVLKAPDIPSLLIELGFLSNAADRARMVSPDWHRVVAEDILAALDTWGEADRAARLRIRQ